MAKALLRQWLKAGFMDKHTLLPTTAGTSQGAICSPVLANLALDGLEGEMRRHFPPSKKGDHAQVHVVRYCDDFIITGRTKEVLEQEVTPLVERFLAGRGLRLSREKTLITHIDEGFDFLGQNVRKYHGKLLIKPSRRSVKALVEKVREVLKVNRQAPAGQVIGQLNPLLRGWANYHCHVVSKTTFAKIDHAIFQALWRWAKRRHPHKARRWIRQRYFTSVRDNHWVFQGTTPGPGVPREHRLHQLASTPIRRHVKVKGEANPYDPAWERYFTARLGVQVAAHLRTRRQELLLWREQKGCCPVCGQLITILTGWHNHHIVRRTSGGSDSAQNRVLLHPACHRHVHSQRLQVAKPRPETGVGKA
jgi:RNA-directed DNA polymerase